MLVNDGGALLETELQVVCYSQGISIQRVHVGAYHCVVHNTTITRPNLTVYCNTQSTVGSVITGLVVVWRCHLPLPHGHLCVHHLTNLTK